MAEDLYKPGDWKATCYACGRDGYASQMVRHWQGYYVHPEHNEARHPQDFVRAVPDRMAPPWTQPRPTDTFVQLCTPNGSSAIADFAVADCVTADYTHFAFDSTVTE